ALVIPTARIPLGILGVEVRCERLEYGRRGVVLAGNEVQGLVVTGVIALEERPDLGVVGLQRCSGLDGHRGRPSLGTSGQYTPDGWRSTVGLVGRTRQARSDLGAGPAGNLLREEHWGR